MLLQVNFQFPLSQTVLPVSPRYLNLNILEYFKSVRNKIKAPLMKIKKKKTIVVKNTRRKRAEKYLWSILIEFI